PNEECVSKSLVDILPKLGVYNSILDKEEYLTAAGYLVCYAAHLSHGTAFNGVGFAEVFKSRPNLAR
ncbi:hypothetical protein BDR04DRAFT_1006834, partial [Suillus decipiens]